MQHKIGDVVILKSGGPRMTVHDIGDYTNRGLQVGVLCVWFDGSKKVEDVFHPETIEHYD
jgi:uncharacterized protein YodC (DUF2158 family)